MSDFHAKHYPELKRNMMRIGQKLSTPDFQVTIITHTRDANFGSSYPFQIKVRAPDYVSEDEIDKMIEDKDWRELIITELCDLYPGAKDTKDGVYIPSFNGYVVIPELTWPVIQNDN